MNPTHRRENTYTAVYLISLAGIIVSLALSSTLAAIMFGILGLFAAYMQKNERSIDDLRFRKPEQRLVYEGKRTPLYIANPHSA